MKDNLKPLIVGLILEGKPEQALELLAKHHNVASPKIKVGLPKARRVRAIGCYTPNNQTISVLNSDALKNPYVILHEFYHHLRTTVDKKHKGTEKKADRFAANFIASYNALATCSNHES